MRILGLSVPPTVCGSASHREQRCRRRCGTRVRQVLLSASGSRQPPVRPGRRRRGAARRRRVSPLAWREHHGRRAVGGRRRGRLRRPQRRHRRSCDVDRRRRSDLPMLVADGLGLHEPRQNRRRERVRRGRSTVLEAPHVRLTHRCDLGVGRTVRGRIRAGRPIHRDARRGRQPSRGRRLRRADAQ